MSILQTSIENGVAWLITQQQVDGSWKADPVGTLKPTPVSITGLALLKLEMHAFEQGISPFSDEYIYKSNVEDGWDYLFAQAKLDAVNGVYFQEALTNYVNYPTGIVLAALGATAEPTRVVNVAGSVVDTKSYKEVADLMVQYLAYSQEDTGTEKGGWAYSKTSGTADNSNSGYTVLGLEFARAPIFNFNCVIPVTLKQKLNSWINYIQNANGGSGYRAPNEWVNIMKTGNLIQQMHLYGDDITSSRLQKAVTYIADNWDKPVCAVGCEGWRDITDPTVTIDYQATFTTMKGLVGYGIGIITTSGGTDIDWFADMSTAIIAQQNPDGSWPRSVWDRNNTPVLSTIWALLTLERAVPGRLTRKQAITDMIQSIALQQAAISHILNAEGEKTQKMLSIPRISTDLLLKTNKSVESMVKSLSKLEIVLQGKLELFEKCLCEENKKK